MRFRKELGDLTHLKESIVQHGLMQPIVMDSNGELIAGARRRQACLELGVEPDVRVIDFANPKQAEIDENTCRKDFTAGEIYEIGKFYNEKLSRQQETQFGNNGDTVSQILTDREQPRDVVAKAVHKSTDTISKINQIFESDSAEVKEKVNSEEISINEGYKRIKSIEKKAAMADTLEARQSETNESDKLAHFYLEAAEVFLSRFESESVDLLLTDPPYSTDVEDVPAFIKTWLPQALSKIKPTGRAFVCIGAYPREQFDYLDFLLNKTDWIVDNPLIWTYRNTLGVTPKMKYNLNYQVILHLYRETSSPLDNSITNEMFAVQDINAPDGRQGDRFHSWQKPDELARRLIAHTTKPGDVVIDTFAATGTFLEAAAQLSRYAFGCDIDREVLDVIKENRCLIKV
jgi:DNA modification methylase